jgi:lactoylglutathione lyase
MKKEKPLLGLRTIVYMVDELEKAKNWYSEAFNIQPYYDTPYYVGFNVQGYELGLHPKESNKDKDTGTTLTYWGVENLEKTYEDLLRLGATTHEKPNNVGGDINLASVYDPWGNIIGIIYNPHFKLL